MAVDSEKSSGALPCLVPQGSFSSKKAMPLKRLATVVGAEDRCHLHLVSSSVSKHHAIIVTSPGEAYISDLGSRTKVLINGEEKRESDLSDGDRIQIGKFEFSFDASGLSPTSKRGEMVPYSIWVDGRTIPAGTRLIFIGRRPGADVHLSNENVSNCHAVIFQSAGDFFIRDMHTRTGTKVNGGRVHQEKIQFGDQIRIGESSIRLIPGTADAPAESALTTDSGIEMAEPETVFPDPALVAEAAEPPTKAPPSTEDTAIPASGEEIAYEPEVTSQPIPLEPPVESVKPRTPPISEPQITQPAISEPAISEPAISEPIIREPTPIEPLMSEPAVSGLPTVNLTPVEIPEPTVAPAIAASEPVAPAIAETVVAEPPASEPAAPQAAEAETPRYRKTRAKIRRIPPAAKKKSVEPPAAIEPSAHAEAPAPAMEISQPPALAEATPAVETPSPIESPVLVESPSPVATSVPVESPPPAATPVPVESPPSIEAPAPLELTADSEVEPVISAEPEPSPEIPIEELPPLRLAKEPPPPQEMEIALNLHPESEAERAPHSIEPESAAEPPAIPMNELNLDLLKSAQSIAPVESPTVAFPSDDLSIEFHDNEVPRPLIAAGLDIPSDEVEPPELQKPRFAFSDALPPQEPQLAAPTLEETIDVAPLENALEELPPPAVKPVEIVSVAAPVAEDSNAVAAEPPKAVPNAMESASEPVRQIIPEPQETQEAKPPPVSPEPAEVIQEATSPPVRPNPIEPVKNLEPIIPMSAMGNQRIVAFEHHLGGMPVYLPRAEVTPPPTPEIAKPPEPPKVPEPTVLTVKPVEQINAADQVKPVEQVKPPEQSKPQEQPKAVEDPKSAKPIAAPVNVTPPAAPKRPPPPKSAMPSPKSASAPAVSTRPPQPVAAASPIKSAPMPVAPPRPVTPPAPARTAFDGLAADPIGRDELQEAAAIGAAASQPISSQQPSDNASTSTFSTSVIPTPEDQTAAAAALTQPVKVSTNPTRRRKVIPFLMLLMMFSMAASCAAVWLFVPAKSHVVGILTFENKSWVSDTDDGNAFESQQHILLNADQTRQHAIEVLHSSSPVVAPGFLASSEKYVGIVNTIALSSETVGGIPQTSVKLIANGDDPNSDGFRMKAILQSLKDANEPALDANNRLRDDANAAAQAVEDIKKKLFQARSDIDAQNQIINGQPTQQELDGLLENKRKAQAAVDHLNGQLDASTGPAQTGDAGLAKLRAQLASLKEQLQAAQDEQSAGISQARADLENAAKEFDDQLSSASAVLDKNSKLKDFFDSANQSQAKVRELINTLLVDGEDFEKQLEDVHREVNDAIQHRQEEKWNADPQLRDLLAQLGTVRRQFNALSSTGNADPKQLDDLKKQVDNWQTQVDARKAQLPVDAGEVKVSEGLDKLSTSLKYKLQLEREQIDQVLNPMEKQLAGLDPDVAALPDNQQDVARQLRQRLDGLNAARKQYAQAIASDQQSPSDKVLSLQKQIDDVKSQLDSPQADSDSQDVLQTALDSANKELQRAQKRADDAQAARGRVLDLGAQLNALNDSLTTATAAQVQKKELAEHAFDILPVSDNDVLVSATDARKDYCLYSIAVLAFVFAMLTMAAHASGNRDSEQQNIQNPPQAPVAVLPIAQKQRPEIRTQRQDSEDDADAVFLDDESGTMAVG